ncbi:MAG: cyclase family protein [Candidatus Latescibacteria bacterium]|nr:cyclase family protein [Candidatus Latescibacterota bacterium]
MAKRIVDLSLEIYHQAPTFSPDPKCGILVHHTIKSMGYNITQIIMSTHQGTHLDAPFHFFDNGRTVDKLDLGKCVGNALVIDLSRKKAKDEIGVEDLKPYESRIPKGAKVLLRTDWDKVYPQEEYFSDQPVITVELSRWLAEKEIDLLGLETPTVHPQDYALIHKTLLEQEIIIVEALAHLRELTAEEVFFAAAPLKIKGRDGSPVRAFAIEVR